MKHILTRSWALAALAGGLCLHAAPDTAGQVDFGKLPPPAAGGEFVEVRIGANLINMAARLVEREEPAAAEMIRGVHAVRVNVVGLDDQNRDAVKAQVGKIRSELADAGWERIVTAQKDKEDVGVFLKTRGDEAVEGLTVTVLEGDRHAVLVNVVGNIRPEKIAELGERLGVEPLKDLGKQIHPK